MLSRRMVLALPLLLLGLSSPARSQASPQNSADPAEPVRRLYGAYGVGDAPDLGRLSRQDAATLYSRSLLALYRQAVKAGLDFDFFVQGQDFSLARPIDIGRVEATGDKASVAVLLTSNFIDPNTRRKRLDRFTFALIRESGRWRIDEARHGSESLRHAWQEMVRNPA